MYKFSPVKSPIDGKILAIKELSDIESEALKVLDFGEVSRKLETFIRANYFKADKIQIGRADISGLDTYLITLLAPIQDQVLQTFIRAGILGILVSDQEQSLKPRRYITPEELPATTKALYAKFKPNPATTKAMEFIETQGLTRLQHATEQTKYQAKETLLESMAAGHNQHDTIRSIQKVFNGDESEINRNWKRVIATELTTAMTGAYLAQTPGMVLLLGRAMEDACDHCKELIDGKLLVKTNEPIPDYQFLDPNSNKYKELAFLWDHCVWHGKNNLGRSQSGKTKAGRERSHHELWTICIPMHPNCRCVWVVIRPELVWIDESRVIRTKQENPEKWQEWYNREVEPLNRIIEKVKKGL